MNTSIRATRWNAISTLISGLGILIFNRELSQIFETSNTIPFLVVGGVITFFSLTMFVELRKQRALAILWIIAQDVMFTLASVYVLIFKPFDISDTGYLLIGLFLIPILFFIFFQSMGLYRMDSINGTNLKQMSFRRKVKGNKEAVWKMVSDVGNYHEVAPNIDGAEILSGDEFGMIRKCSHGKDSWTETCTLWEEGNEYSFEVDTSPADYPYPLKTLRGNWQVKEVRKQVTEIIMNFEFEYKKPIQHILIHPILKHQFNKVGEELLDNWQRRIEKQAS